MKRIIISASIVFTTIFVATSGVINYHQKKLKHTKILLTNSIQSGYETASAD